MIDNQIINGVLCWRGAEEWHEYSASALTSLILQLQKENNILAAELRVLEVTIKEFE